MRANANADGYELSNEIAGSTIKNYAGTGYITLWTNLKMY